MTDAERRMLRLYARRSGLRHAIKRARSVVRDWLSRCQKPYVAWSAGKDSTALLDLVRSEANVVALFGDDEHLYPGTEQIIEATENIVRVCGPSQHTDWYCSWEDPAASDIPEGAVWVDSDPSTGSVITYAQQEGYDGAAIGLRTEESGTRSVHIRSHGKVFFAEGKGVWQCYPLADCSTRDVWAYIIKNDLKYHPAYDVMAEEGVPIENRRIGPFAPKYAADTALSVLRRCFPEAFRHFIAEHPEAQHHA